MSDRNSVWSVDELAQAAGVFPTYIRRLCANGKLSAYKVGERTWAIPREAGQAWLEERKAKEDKSE